MSAQHIKWNRNGLCGAACAQMVLHAHGATGTTSADQEVIWTSIMNGTKGSPPLQCTGVVPEPFPNMKQETCSRSRVMCWETYPNVLKAILKASLGRAVTVSLRQTPIANTANGRIKNCLERGGLPIVLVNSGAHWVLVDDWNDDADKPVSVLDPANYEPSAFTVAFWNALFLAAVDCGKYDGKYVIVEVG